MVHSMVTTKVDAMPLAISNGWWCHQVHEGGVADVVDNVGMDGDSVGAMRVLVVGGGW